MLGGAIIIIVAGLAMAVLGELAREGRLPYNRYAGLRSAAIMHDETTWRAGHRAAAPWLLGGAAAAFVTAAVTLAGGSAGWVRTVTLGLLVLMVGCVYAATRIGDQAAKQTNACHHADRGAERADRGT